MSVAVGGRLAATSVAQIHAEGRFHSIIWPGIPGMYIPGMCMCLNLKLHEAEVKEN